MANDQKNLNWVVNTAAGFTADNQILPATCAGLESDTGLIKYGDGVTAWADLTYTTQGVGQNARVRAATTANITISTALNNGDTLDGVTLATGDLVLVKNQSSASGNGIYVVGATPARADNYDTYNEHAGILVSVTEGSTNADTLWLCTSNAGGTLDSTSITFSAFGGGGIPTTDILRSYLASTVTYNNVDTLADTALSVTVAASGIYEIELYVFSTRADGASAGLNMDFAGTATIANFIGQWVAIDSEDPNGTGDTGRVSAAGTDSDTVAVSTAASSDHTFKGTVEITDAGTFLLRGAQNTAHASNTTILRGSFLKLTKLN